MRIRVKLGHKRLAGLKKPFLLKHLACHREPTKPRVLGRRHKRSSPLSGKGFAVGVHQVVHFQRISGTARASNKASLLGRKPCNRLGWACDQVLHVSSSYPPYALAWTEQLGAEKPAMSGATTDMCELLARMRAMVLSGCLGTIDPQSLPFEKA